jgi:hypothetical protein
MTIEMETIQELNRCQISDMKKVGESLDPALPNSCEIFSEKVFNVQCAIVNTYQIVAHLSLREPDPAKAAGLWKQVGEVFDMALKTLKGLKDVYPHCSASNLYDMTLDFKLEADKRRRANEQDAECLKTPLPIGLFQKMS